MNDTQDLRGSRDTRCTLNEQKDVVKHEEVRDCVPDLNFYLVDADRIYN